LQRETTKNSRQITPKACFSWFHKPSVPGMNEAAAEDLLDAHFTLKGKTFSEMMNTNTTECPNKLPRKHDGRFGVCVKPLCTKFGGSCSDLEDDLESAALAGFGVDLDYTTDDDICG